MLNESNQLIANFLYQRYPTEQIVLSQMDDNHFRSLVYAITKWPGSVAVLAACKLH